MTVKTTPALSKALSFIHCPLLAYVLNRVFVHRVAQKIWPLAATNRKGANILWKPPTITKLAIASARPSDGYGYC